VVTSGTAAERGGQYEIDGYVLTLRYQDGRVEQRLIVTDAADPKVVWIDGNGYTS
jgi:carotenoid cleavage dioxygenase-like enzyme